MVLVLNLLLVCVGYFWLGQWQKGVSALAALFALTVGTLFLGAIFVPVLIALTTIDGYLQAKERAAGRRISQWSFFRSSREIPRPENVGL